MSMNLAGVELNRTRAAQTLGVSVVTIDNYILAGMPAVKNGKNWVINSKEAITWLVDRARNGVGSAPDSEFAQAKLAEMQYTAKLKQLSFETQSSQLVEYDVINRWFTSVILHAVQEFLRIGPELQDELAEERSATAIGRKIEARIRRVLSGLKIFAVDEAKRAA